MYYKLVTAEDICHHGIKGQRWGVRRYQNKDGSLTRAGKKRYGSDGIGDLTDEELRARINRLNKERSYRQAVADTARLRQGPSKVKSVLSVAETAFGTAQSIGKLGAVSNKYKASRIDVPEDKLSPEEKAKRKADGIGPSPEALKREALLAKSVRKGQEAALAKEGGNLSKNLGKLTGREKKAAKMNLSKLSDEELNDRINRINLERSYLQMMNETSKRGAGRERTIKVLQDVGTVAASAASVTSIAMTVKSIMDANKKKD